MSRPAPNSRPRPGGDFPHFPAAPCSFFARMPAASSHSDFLHAPRPAQVWILTRAPLLSPSDEPSVPGPRHHDLSCRVYDCCVYSAVMREAGFPLKADFARTNWKHREMVQVNVTRNSLRNAVSKSTPRLSRREASQLVEAFLDEIADALSRGQAVRLHGFGVLKPRVKRERPGRNPKRPQEPARIAARVSVSFRPSVLLVARLNSARELNHGARSDLDRRRPRRDDASDPLRSR